MASTADALIAVLRHVLDCVHDLNRIEYVNRGRKYRYVNDQFRRLSDESKHLVVDPQNTQSNTAISSAYAILHSIDDGLLLQQFPNLCLGILAVARDLEAHRWFDEGTGLVTTMRDAQIDLDPWKARALQYSRAITNDHSTRGFDIMVYAKLNFLFTDHHIGNRLNDPILVDLVESHFGEEALVSSSVLAAIKCFVHWGHTQAILSRLGVPNVMLSSEIAAAFDLFPQVNARFKALAARRFPSGTSRYYLLQKCIQLLRTWPFAKLIPFTQSNKASQIQWLVDLCTDIQRDPIKYHLRAESKRLSESPVNLRELQGQTEPQASFWLSFAALMFDWFDVPNASCVQNDSRLPIVDSNLCEYIDEVLGEGYCEELKKIKITIDSYEAKGWEAADIVNRLVGDDPLLEALAAFDALPLLDVPS